MINRSNYEAWFLDFVEGRLSEKEIGRLMDFLDRHPDLKPEFDEEDLVTISPPLLGFPDKEALKYPEIEELHLPEIDRLLIDELEGTLTTEGAKELAKRIAQDATAKKARQYYQLTTFSAVDTIPFPNKSELKKKEMPFLSIRLLSRIAAVGILLISAYIVIVNTTDKPDLPKVDFVEIPITPTQSDKPAEVTIPPSITPITKSPAINPLTTEHQIVQVHTPPKETSRSLTHDTQEKAIPQNVNSISMVTPDTNLPINHQEKIEIAAVQIEQSIPPLAPIVSHLNTPIAPVNSLPTQLPEKPVGPTSDNHIIDLSNPKEVVATLSKIGVDKVIKLDDNQPITAAGLLSNTVGSLTNQKAELAYENSPSQRRFSIGFGKVKITRVTSRK